MSAGHSLFASLTTAYIFVGIMPEKRDLIGMFGDEDRHYRERVSMSFPWRDPPDPLLNRLRREKNHETYPEAVFAARSRSRSRARRKEWVISLSFLPFAVRRTGERVHSWKPEAVRITAGAQHVATFEKTPMSQRKTARSAAVISIQSSDDGPVDVFAATFPTLPFTPGYVNYAETVLPIWDGLPKLKEFPAELGCLVR